MHDLRERVVLITGASKGLGEALAVAFARAGARVSLCARTEADLRRVAERVRAAGAQCSATVADVTDPAAVARWVEETEHRLGAPSVLIHNASVLGPRVPLAEYPLEEWRRVLDVNLTGALVTAQAVLPSMLRAGHGSIIHVSSGAARPPRENWGAYAVSKHALEGFSTNLAHELADAGIRVNVVDPGAMRTGMRAAAYPTEDPATLEPPAERVDVFCWLASDRSRGVTGQRFEAHRWP